MTLQAIRRYFEAPIETALSTFNIPIRYENQLVPDSGADLEYAKVSLNFGLTAEVALSCALENMRGALIVEIFLEKGYGPARGQEVAAAVMQSLYSLNDRPAERINGVLGRIDPIVGPAFTPLADQPYFLVSLSTGVIASVKTP